MNRMFRRTAVLAMGMVIASLFAACSSSNDTTEAPAAAPATSEVFFAVLAGAQENPPVLTAADGIAALTLNTSNNQLTGSVTTANITATDAHIHLGEPGLNGGVIVPLTQTAPASGIWNVPTGTTLTAAQVAALNAGGLYVNVHSALNPGGQIRGQIGRLVLTARLTGTQENPPNASGASGTGVFSVDRLTRALTARVVTSGVNGTAAHIHTGTVGNNGPVIVNFSQTAPDSGIWVPSSPTILTEEQVLAFGRGGLYMNVHSAANPGGEIRGQIGLDVYDVAMVGAQEVPPVTGGTATSRIVVNPVTRELTGSINNVSVAATAGHIHGGVFGVNGGVVIGATASAPGAALWNYAPTTLTAAQYRALLFGNWYANTHSAANPGGEARGQIGNVVRTGLMSGANEVPANTSAASGRAIAILNPNTLEISITLITAGMTTTAAHLHVGAVGANGGVIVPLVQGANANTWVSAAGAKLTQAQAVSFASGGTYFNAHSAAFPGGEVRAQATGLD